mgnify:CR=1 FL=1
MKKVIAFLKKLNPHIIIPCFILLCIVLIGVFIAKWAKGEDSTYNRDEVEEGYDIEVLDRVYYMTPDLLGEHTPNETKKVLCFGNAPFADDRDSENNLCNLIAKETGAEIINVSIPDSYMAMRSPGINVEDPMDYYTFYWLTTIATLKSEKVYTKYNNLARGTSEIGDEVVDYLYALDMNTVDTIVLMYDATDYLEGRIKETSDNLTNPLTFCGNMFAGIEMIQDLYPHIQIIVMSPTYAYAINEDGEYESSDIIKVEGESLSAYAITQLNLCQVVEITFIDNIYGTVNCDNADMYLTDNVHLNLEGRKAVAQRFSEIFEKTWNRYYELLEK